MRAPDMPEGVASTGAKVERADITAAEKLGRHRDDSAVRALGGLSEIADQAPALTVCGVVLVGGLVSRKPRVAQAGARMLAAVLVATAMKAVVKRSVSRARPHVLLNEGQYVFKPHGPKGGDWHSFPSGHTADAVAAARGLARAVPEMRATAYAVAGAIGAVQIPRAKHYPLDVVAGAVIGVTAELAVHLAGRYACAKAFRPHRIPLATRAHDGFSSRADLRAIRTIEAAGDRLHADAE